MTDDVADTSRVRKSIDERPPFEDVLVVLSRVDPEGVLAAGAPSDEYAPEADDLAGQLRAGRPITAEAFIRTWEHWFGPGSGYLRRTPSHQVAELAAELDMFR